MKSILPTLAALCVGLAGAAVLVAPANAAGASDAGAPAKAGSRSGARPSPQAAGPAGQRAGRQSAAGTQINHDQYALRPERDTQPRSSFGLRMKPGWDQQGDPDGPGR
ncbi:hypothetical protein P3W85_31090 [Cupriavidus basilensis]|uniref:Uncharacterized protein n=1 Tax=Cupriavidus basilensis TaxID=68895 RepID=A0ABT6AXK3_9BURK|nr:hypothetical protein [Cupriavidus basilensis]MDF3837360.1 hypothetical protein [Cupriavidus basilensis]